MPVKKLAAAIKARRVCEQAHQQLKEELGLDHFEGRSWIGLHRYALMAMIAYVKSVEKRRAWIDSHGYDAGKKVKGKKRHVLVDTQGFVLHAIVTAADIQDRDGGTMLLATLFGMFPFLLKLYVGGGYQGPEFQKALKRVLCEAETEIVKRSDRQKGFVVLPRRWEVERTLAWLNRSRRLAKDWENLNLNARAFLLLVSIRLMVRGQCRA